MYDRAHLKYVLRKAIRKYVAMPSIVRDGNSFLLMDGRWLLLSGPWHEALKAHWGQLDIFIPRVRPYSLTNADPYLKECPVAVDFQEARWRSIKWANITQAARATALRDYPFLHGRARAFTAFYCEDGHLPLTLDDRPYEWIGQ